MSIGLTNFSSDFSARSIASLNLSSRMRARSFWLSICLSNRFAASLFCASRFETIASSESEPFLSFGLCSSTSPLTRSITIVASQSGQVISKLFAMAVSVYRLPQVFEEVLRVLQARRHTKQVFRRAGAGALARRAVLDETFRPAQRGRADDHLDARRDAQRFLAASADEEREHAAEVAHLLPRDLVTGMRGEPGVVDPLDIRVRCEHLRDRAGVLAMHAHPRGKGADAAEHEPGVERRRHAAEDRAGPLDRLEQLAALGERQRAALNVAVAAEVLGGRVEHDVGA